MDAKLKTKWIRALRSGRYEQHSGTLANMEGTAFCCLGVLADIQGCLWKDAANHSDDLLPVSPVSGRVVGDGIIHNRNFRGGLSDDKQNELGQLNDDGRSFKFIADFIEKNL